MDDIKTFGDRVKSLRKEKKLTQKQVAMDMGLGQSAIANYEQGTRFPDETTLKAITEYFNTSLDYLLGIKRVKQIFDTVLDKDDIKKRYQDLMLNNSFDDALDLLIKSIESGHSLSVIFKDILLPLLRKMGDLWESTQIDVAREHLLSEEIERSIGIITYKKSHNVIKSTRCVCTTGGSEMHRITIRMIAELLKDKGYPTWFLGLSTPTTDLINLCKRDRINLLILSATLNSSIDSINNIIEGIRLDPSLDNMKIITGGPAFERNPEVMKSSKADYVINNLDTLIDVVQKDFK